jgi:geranylgeranyl diphosphate synthase type II
LPPEALQTHLDALRSLVERELTRCLDTDLHCPPQLLEALRYSLLAPGKRLRPLLTLLSAEATGARTEQAMPAACALEMVHCYSLIHDDLPAMDDDDLRRGRPTCHKQFDEATAILAGDGLLTLAFQCIAVGVQPGDLAARCCAELAEAAGVGGMVGGQAEDLAWERRTGARLGDLQAIHSRKTGALFRAAVRLGALIGLWSALRDRAGPLLTALTEYAEALGLAFQIADDLLDVEGSETETGKRVQKDAARGKLTYPGLVGVPASREILRQACAAAQAALAPLGDAARHLSGMVQLIAERTK